MLDRQGLRSETGKSSARYKSDLLAFLLGRAWSFFPLINNEVRFPKQAFLCEFDKNEVSVAELKSYYKDFEIDVAKPVQNEVTSTLFCGDFDLPSIDSGGTQGPVPSGCASSSESYKTGDMDGDGTLTILDLFKMIRALMKIEEFDECQVYFADKFGKSGFNVVDVAGWTRVILCASIVPGETLDQLICSAYQ